jgi:hypothetical protein
MMPVSSHLVGAENTKRILHPLSEPDLFFWGGGLELMLLSTESIAINWLQRPGFNGGNGGISGLLLL